MCQVDNQSQVTGATGLARYHRASDRIAVDFKRFNYVFRSNLGRDLDDNWVSWLANPLGQASDFGFIRSHHGDYLRDLFSVSRDSGIPRSFRAKTSNVDSRCIVLYSQNTDKLIMIDYVTSRSWHLWEFDLTRSNWQQPVIDVQGSDTLVGIRRSDLRDCKGIALPAMVTADNAFDLFTANGRLRSASEISGVLVIPGSGEAEARLYVFDPAHIIEHTIRVIRYCNRHLRVIDPRQPFSRSGRGRRRLSSWERDARTRGILATLSKQIVDSKSSLRSHINQSQLNSEFQTWGNVSYRRSLFFDNITNFIRHPIMQAVKENLMHHEEGFRPGGIAWLDIIAPLAEIAGEHPVLAEYFAAETEEESADSSFAAFARDALATGSASESAWVGYWKRFLNGSKFAKLAAGLAAIRSYQLTLQYTNQEISWSSLGSQINDERTRLRRYVGSLNRVENARTYIGNIQRAFTYASRANKVYAILRGDISRSSFTLALEGLSSIATSYGLKTTASRITVIKQIVDLVPNIQHLGERIECDDYNAAFGYGLVVAGSVAQIYVTYTLAGASAGPWGAIIGIVIATGSVIVIFATDSEYDTFFQHSKWRRSQGALSSGQPPWAARAFNRWDNESFGDDYQLDSLLNIMHRFTVHHNYDPYTHVIVIRIKTKFLPESATFQFKGEFQAGSGPARRAEINVRYPGRSGQRRRPFRYTAQRGCPIRGGHSRVTVESGQHVVQINISVDRNFTSANGYLRCLPFGHEEFTVPHDNKAFRLESLEHDNIVVNRWRDYEFTESEWGSMPGW